MSDMSAAAPRCESCPVAAAARCRSDLLPWLCGLAARGPAQAAHVVGRSAIADAGATARPAVSPPLRRRAATMAGAVGRFVASGLVAATPEERARRLTICRSNECGRFIGGRCAECGCILKYKIAMLSEHCPLSPPRW